MKHVLAFILFLVPALALAHPAPFGHHHGLLDHVHGPVLVLLLAAMAAALWIWARSRR